MPTTVVNTHDAKSRLSELIRLAQSGEEVLIARNGEVIAKLVPWPAARTRRRPGRSRSRVRFDPVDVMETDADTLAAFEASASRPA